MSHADPMDEDEGPSRRKRLCPSFSSAEDLSRIDRNDLSAALLKICSTNVKLLPYRLSSCNAATKFEGVEFSKAFCELENLDTCFVLGDVFRRGVLLGIDFLDGKIPETKHEKILLEKLVGFLKLGEVIDFNFDNDSDRTVMLANHLFGKLAISADYTIDKNCKRERIGTKCSCKDGSCIMTGDYGDTSIGNPQVWHGCADIIIKNDLIVENLEKDPDSPVGKSPIKDKMKSNTCTLSRNPRLVAETIVFSFLQKKKHPELSNHLIPCIGIADSAIVVMFYDSEHDVLLESSLIPLAFENKFSIEAILIIWLAVNYKFLCTGLTDEMLPYKAGFFEEAKERMSIFENELKIQNVAQSFSRKDRVLPSGCSLNAFLLDNQKRIIEVTSKWTLKDKN